MWQCKEVFENDQRNGEAEIMEVPSSPHKVEALWHIQTCIIASGLIVNRLQVDLSRNSELNGKYNWWYGFQYSANDPINSSCSEIVNEILKLKNFKLEHQKDCQGFNSLPIARTDSIGFNIPICCQKGA